MNIRPASFRDLARIEELHREAAAGEDATGRLHDEHPVPQATLLRLWYAVSKTLSSLVPLSDTADELFIAEEPRQGVIGFIQAQSAGGKNAWQIVNLCVASTGAGHFARERLLTQLCNHGMEHGIHRFLVRVPVDDPLVAVFLEQGFIQFATEQILFREAPDGAAAQAGPLATRAARRDDLAGVYLLYLRTTPSHIASFEGPSFKAWQSSYGNGSIARFGRDEARHIVAEHPGIVGWAAIRPEVAGRPTALQLMCEGHDPEIREAMIDAALAEVPSGPVSCVLRHYDSELIRSLQQRGFAVYGTQLLLVKDSGARVHVRKPAKQKKPLLVPAGVARSVPVSTTTAAQILNLPERRERSSPR